jgi:hypothetical protein
MSVSVEHLTLTLVCICGLSVCGECMTIFVSLWGMHDNFCQSVGNTSLLFLFEIVEYMSVHVECVSVGTHDNFCLSARNASLLFLFDIVEYMLLNSFIVCPCGTQEGIYLVVCQCGMYDSCHLTGTPHSDFDFSL